MYFHTVLRCVLWHGRPFVLLAGTTVTLLLLVLGSVGLLSGVGGEKLPSTLTGGVGHSAR